LAGAGALIALTGFALGAAAAAVSVVLAFLAADFDAAVEVFAKASPGMAAKDVATAIDTATDIAVRSATPCITFSGENISVFISVLFWGGERVPQV
jgi:hypothetical protein